MNSDNKLVSWIIPSGVVARVFSPSTLDDFLGAAGVQIDEGTRAAVLLNGAMQQEIGPGVYRFDQPPGGFIKKGIEGFLKWLAGLFRAAGVNGNTSDDFKLVAEDAAYLAKDVTSYAVVVCRTSPFESGDIVFDSARGGEALHANLLLKVGDIGKFVRWVLAEAPSQGPSARGQISVELLRLKIQSRLGVRGHAALSRGSEHLAEAEIKGEWSALCGDLGLEIVHLLSLATTAQRAVKDKTAEFAELQELLDIQLRLEKANNELGLGLGLAEDERREIEQMLRKRDLVREQDLGKFSTEQAMQIAVIDQALESLRQKLRNDLQAEQLEMDAKLQLREARLSVELGRLKSVEGARTKAESEEIERSARIRLDAAERDSRLEAMAKLVAIRGTRDRTAIEGELQKIAAMKDLTPEQILLINPNISKEAAEAMASKFSSEVQRQAADQAIAQSLEMKSFLEKMAEEQRRIVAAALASGKQVASEISKAADSQIRRAKQMSSGLRPPTKSELAADKKSEKLQHEGESEEDFELTEDDR